MITVFTPAYNRAKFLPRLYESLCKQTYKDFEWVIVDDGSVDDTRSVVEQFSVLGFEFSGDRAQSLNTQHSTLNTNTIRYFYQENGGKHRAINRGVKESRGELFFIADSDDILPPDAMEIVAKQYDGIKEDNSFAGVAGFDIDIMGKRIGRGYEFDILDCNILDFWYKYHVSGDMKEVFRTEVLKEIPFPEIEGERFCPEELEWVRIAMRYKLRYFNQNIYVADYQEGGLTDRIVQIRMQSPIAAMMTYAVSLPLAIPFFRKVRYAINYYRFKACLRQSDYRHEFRKYNVQPVSFLWCWAKPFGLLMHRRDKHL